MCHHQFTLPKHFLTSMLVCISLVLSIGSLQVSSHLGMNLRSLFCHMSCCFASSNYCWYDSHIINIAWGTCIDNLKMSLTNRSIHHTILSELDLKACSFPVSLVVTTNTTQHIIQSSIDHFHLSICLRMKNTNELQLCNKIIVHMRPKFTNELHIPIRSNNLWNTMQTHHFSKIDVPLKQYLQSSYK